MIAEIGLAKKRALIIACIVFALLIHVTPLRVRIYTNIIEPFSRNKVEPIISPDTQKPIQPIMLTKQIPANVLKQLQAIRKQQKVTATLEPAPKIPEQPKALLPPPKPTLPEPAPPEPVPPEPKTHKIFRAGTSFDAPKTDHAISPASAKPSQPKPQEKKVAPPKTIVPEKKTEERHDVVLPEPEAIITQQEPAEKTLKKKDKSIPIHNRLMIKKHAEEDEIVKITLEEKTPASQQETHNRTITKTHTHPTTEEESRPLNFLSQENFEKIIRDQLNLAVTDDGQNNQHEYAGSFYGASTTHNQYGDPRFLHYNSKIYHALQQSMSIVINTLSAMQYRNALDGVRSPTRIRFALDREGAVISIVITRSSGNMRYDNLSYKIVQEASYPSIPKSFGLSVTYHQYGILLYDVGPGPHQNIGVSPYLEGE